MNSRFYTITFTTSDGSVQAGRSFVSLRAARKWARWVSAQPYASAVKLYRGGPGGMLEEAA